MEPIGQTTIIDPIEQEIRVEYENGQLGPAQETVNIGGYEYYLTGSRLQRVGGNALQGYNLGSYGPSRVIVEPNGRYLLWNTINPQYLNSAASEIAYYGAGADFTAVDVTGEEVQISVPFEYIAAEGNRLARRTLDNGTVEYFEASGDITTNAALRELMRDETAEFLNGREAAIQAIFRYMLRHNHDLLSRIVPGTANPTSDEIRSWISSQMDNLVGYSKTVISYAY